MTRVESDHWPVHDLVRGPGHDGDQLRVHPHLDGLETGDQLYINVIWRKYSAHQKSGDNL